MIVTFDNLGLSNVIVIVGHYGVGKTSLSINFALDAASINNKKVTICDLDIVNPYFRSSDYVNFLNKSNVNIVCPVLANTSLDTPSLSAKVYSEISKAHNNEDCICIIDVGGDDDGAKALGRFSKLIKSCEYNSIYVVNKNRYLIGDKDDAVKILCDIQNKSQIKVTNIINNTHMCEQTSVSDILDGIGYAHEISDEINIPFMCTTLPHWLIESTSDGIFDKYHDEKFYSMRMHLNKPWDV